MWASSGRCAINSRSPAVERRSDLAVVTTDNPRGEMAKDIAADILNGFNRRSAAVRIDDRAEAIRFAIESARDGDSVLIAGKGHEACQIVGGSVIPFDDRAVAAGASNRRFAPRDRRAVPDLSSAAVMTTS